MPGGNYQKVSNLSERGVALMSSFALADGLRHLRGKMAAQKLHEESDEQLLHAFLSCSEESAFAVLVGRHGPMVLQVCRRVLGHAQDAEDAFQATFLVLARNAATLRNKTALASWLYGTAYRLSMKAKQSAVRRRKHERQAPDRPSENPADELSWREVRAILDEEIACLPEIYRSAFVLCCLESLTIAEAARRLGLKQGTVASRLAESRKRLQRTLGQRGIELTAVLAASALAAQSASALPPVLISTTIKAVMATAQGGGTAGLISSHVADLVRSTASTAMLSKAKTVATMLLAFSVLAGVGAWTYGTLAQPRPAEQQAQSSQSHTASSPQFSKAKNPEAPQWEKGDFVTVSGQVQDPDGKPLAGATIYYYLFSIESLSGREARDIRETTGSNGRFRFQIPRSTLDKLEQDTPWDKVTVIASAKGYGPAWTSFITSSEALRLKLRLSKDDVPINARILDLEGRPIQGVTIRTHVIEDAQSGILDLDVLPRLQMEARTDAQGRFRLTGIGRDRDVKLSLRGPTIAAREYDLYVMTRDAKTYHKLLNPRAPELGKISYYGATADIVAAPTKPIIGTVRDKDTGKPLAGVTIQSQLKAGSGRLLQDFLQTTSDQEGRYRLFGMPKGKGNEIVAVAPSGQPYFLSLKDVGDTLGLDPVRVDFALKRGVWIRGRVTDKVTGKPVRAKVRYGTFPDNPHRRGVPGYDGSATAVTGDDGSFAVLGLPGRGLIAVKADEDRYLTSIGADKIPAANKHSTNFESILTHPLFVSAEYHAFVQVNPAADGKAAACDVHLDPGKSVQGNIVDADGKPLDGVRVMDLKLMWSRPQPLAGSRFTANALDPRHPRQLFFYHREKHLGAAVQVRGDEEKPLTVRLQPCGIVTGRILDSKGHPYPEWSIYGQSESKYMSITTGRWWELYVSGRTDKEGRFRIDLIPDVKYHIPIGAQNHVSTLKPGETKDLGDIKVETAQ
jgi:RNA polymerase sigma factor (sigma-70 family)